MRGFRITLPALVAALVGSPAPALAQGPVTPAPAPAMPTVVTQPSADPGARPIALDQAVQLAQRNSPLAVQARGSERTARAAVRSSYAAFIPNVSVSAGSNRSFNTGTTRLGSNGEVLTVAPKPWSYSSGLSLGMDLFDGGRRFYDISSARAGVDAADANDVAQKYRIALDVKQQYFNVVAARESEAAARAQLQQAEQQLRAASTRVAAGAATKSDSLRSVIAVGNAQLALLTAQNDVRVADAALTRLVGSETTVTAADDSTMNAGTVPVDTGALFQMAESGPAIRQGEANVAAARARRRATRAPYLPTVSASYSRSGSGTDSRFGSGPATYTCGTVANPAQCESYAYNGALRFSLSYQLFNQLGREEAVTGALVAEDNAEASLRDARLQAKQSIVQYVGALQTAQQRIAIQSASVAAAEEDLRVQQQRYQLGASTLLDVLTSQTQLDQARAALIAARYDYRVARAQLETIIGKEL